MPALPSTSVLRMAVALTFYDKPILLGRACFHSTKMRVKPRSSAAGSGRKSKKTPAHPGHLRPHSLLGGLDGSHTTSIEPLDLARVKVLPLAERKSLSQIEEILIDPSSAPPDCDSGTLKAIEACVAKITTARKKGASVILMYGAHLIKNGAMEI